MFTSSHRLSRPRLAVLVLAVLSLLSSYRPAAAFFGGKIDSFSADYVTISPQGREVNNAKVHIIPGCFRMDGMPGMGAGPNAKDANLSVLTREEGRQSYILNHEKKLYFAQDHSDEIDMGPRDFSAAETIRVLGQEKVSGYDCIKKEVMTRTEVYGQSREDRMIIWESDKFVMPLKTQGESGHSMEFKNIKPGKPDAALFVLPADYRQVDNMMAVMGLSFGRPRTPAPAAGDDQPGSVPPAGNREELEKAIQNLGEKLKNFKFGE
ncbi:MAG: DUF4412 domain-containing protein [Deltaproteobacteria bacterium]|nr:DUF4412 domain-containing protein [Deltaproteobacteria bacterium]